MRKADYLRDTLLSRLEHPSLGLSGLHLGLTRGGGGVSGFTLYASPLIDTTGTTGVISQLYTNLTGTLVFSKVSGDADISVASDGEISTSAALFDGDSATFIARVEDSVSGTFIEAPITIEGSVVGSYAYESWTGPGWLDFSDTGTLTLTGANIDAVTNKRAGGGDLTYGGTAGGITTVAAVQNGRAVARLVRDVSSNTSLRRLVASTGATLSTMFSGADQPYTVICVYIPRDNNEGSPWAATQWTNSSNFEHVGIVRRTTAHANAGTVRKWRNTTGGTNFNIGWGSGGQAQDTPRIVAVKHTGTAVTVWDTSLTKALDASPQDIVTLTATMTFALGATQSNSVLGPWATAQCNLDYCEVVIENSAKSDADVQQAITDLATKWGITLS